MNDVLKVNKIKVYIKEENTPEYIQLWSKLDFAECMNWLLENRPNFEYYNFCDYPVEYENNIRECISFILDDERIIVFSSYV
jgi:hypothetical protein